MFKLRFPGGCCLPKTWLFLSSLSLHPQFYSQLVHWGKKVASLKAWMWRVISQGALSEPMEPWLWHLEDLLPDNPIMLSSVDCSCAGLHLRKQVSWLKLLPVLIWTSTEISHKSLFDFLPWESAQINCRIRQGDLRLVTSRLNFRSLKSPLEGILTSELELCVMSDHHCHGNQIGAPWWGRGAPLECDFAGISRKLRGKASLWVWVDPPLRPASGWIHAWARAAMQSEKQDRASWTPGSFFSPP